MPVCSRGARGGSLQRAIQAGYESGVALQVMVKNLDAGPLLGLRKSRWIALML